jgi:hypothetical protein
VCVEFFQRGPLGLSDTWRSAIGSTGIAVVNTFFESKDDLATDEERKAFAKDGLKDLKFLLAIYCKYKQALEYILFLEGQLPY